MVRALIGLLAACLLSPSLPAADWFTDRARESGLVFVHFNGMSGAFYYPEVVGPGAAFLDYDNDGDQDVYLVQGRMLGGLPPAKATFPPPAGAPEGGRLFRNDLSRATDGSPKLRFTDVTAASGIRALDYGIGVASGDVDNDGWPDLYLTNYGPNRLWRNRGDGTFEDVTSVAGVGDPRLSVSAAFLDYDRDGHLDLFVVNHVAFDVSGHKPCEGRLGGSEYCATDMYPAVPDRLYHNRGDGTFEDVTRASGVARAYGAGLGVVVADFDNDGWPDIYVANDGDPNQLWINTRDGRFREEALLAGAAVNMDGAAEAGMGVDAGDFDEDGDEDLFMTHDTQETNTLYVNDGHGWFEDRTVAAGLGVPSQPYTGFGTAWADLDNDGWLDLFVANGAVRTLSERSAAGDPYPLGQVNQLFRNLGDGRFLDVTAEAGVETRRAEVSRGAAFGDVDNDGDLDILVANNSGPARLLSNQWPSGRHWLGLRLLDATGKDALGARVRVTLPAGRQIWRRARTDASYASANDPRVLIGLADEARIAGLWVRWPDGRETSFDPLPVDRYHTLRQGRGNPRPAP